MARRGKISTEGEQEDLNNPFAALSSEGLPEGPAVLPELEDEGPPDSSSAKKGRVVLRRETASRGGKTVIVIGDFDSVIAEEEIQELGRNLRKHCSCGGAVKGREIEIQGDQPRRIREFLEAAGFRVAGIR